jgi:hypothetical protein
LLQRDIIRVKCHKFLRHLHSLASNLFNNDTPIQAFFSYAWPEILTTSKIKSSHIILWIGTPELKSRITFGPDKKPSTNAAVEFCHIKDKDITLSKQIQPSSPPLWSIQSLWFHGKSALDAFPDGHNLNTVLHDFTQEQDYFIHLSRLVASIFGILNTPSFKQEFSEYHKNVTLWEKSFSLYHQLTTPDGRDPSHS